ncbi:hypothetical protein Tco_1357760, partial [Tanacetum coccineum]
GTDVGPTLDPLPSSIDALVDSWPRKRVRFDAPSHRFEIGESLTAAATREPGLLWPEDSYEFYVRHQDAHDDRAVLRSRISTLERERRYHRTMDIAAEQEAIYARHA